jgi:2,5-diketo-D-gluconate reductase A
MSTVRQELELLHGATIPRIGLGTWPMDDRQAERAVAAALESGYRLVDTAEAYGNERGVGLGVKASGVPRSEVFLTTKFNRRWHGADLVPQAFERSAAAMGVDYIDLMLIHWPNPGHDRYVEAWQGLIGLLEQGLVRAIGTSNFKPAHLDRLITETQVAPDVNQIELNPYVARVSVREFHERHGIVTESWSPVGGSSNAVLNHGVITRIASDHGRTPAQVVLRWHVQSGLVAVPKSSHPERIRENLQVFDFELTEEEMARIGALDEGEAAATDSDAYGH